MKKLDLNIKLDEPIMGEDKKEMKGYEVATMWIGIMIRRATNKPKFDQRTGGFAPTQQADMEATRKYGNVVNALKQHKGGIVEIDDDDFNYINRKFHQAELPLQDDVAGILIKIEDAINKTKVGEKGK